MTIWPTISLDFDVSSVEAALTRLGGAISPSSLSAFLRDEGAEVLRNRARARFDQEGDDASGPWAQLKRPTIEIRESEGYPGAHPINVRTGNLRNFVTGARGVVAATGDGARLTWPGGATPDTEQKLQTAQRGKASPPTVARPVVAANELDLFLLTTGIAHWVTDLAGLEIA